MPLCWQALFCLFSTGRSRAEVIVAFGLGELSRTLGADPALSFRGNPANEQIGQDVSSLLSITGDQERAYANYPLSESEGELTAAMAITAAETAASAPVERAFTAHPKWRS